MTTENDDLQDRVLRFGEGFVNSQGVGFTAFGDPAGQYPRLSYVGAPSINQGVTGSKVHRLSFGGAASSVPTDMSAAVSTQYPHADVRETASGHVIELNDTPGGERILFRHNSGSGIELRPDGSIVLSSLRNKIEVVNGTSTVIVEGDASLVYRGNLDLNVTGDLNINCLNFNVNASSSYSENINGNRSSKVMGNSGSTVSGHRSITTVGNNTDTTFGSRSLITKGNWSAPTQGNIMISAHGNTSITAEGEAIMSSPNINIAASNLSVFGDTGTIGGENIIMYNYNMHTGHTVWAGDTIETQTANISNTVNTSKVTAGSFHGDLFGTASAALAANVAAAPGGGGATQSASSAANVASDTTATAIPSGALLQAYLNNSNYGVQRIAIDVDNSLVNALRRRTLNPSDVRAKMRDAEISGNTEFVAEQISRGNLNPNYNSPTPPGGVGRVRSGTSPLCQTGTQTFGNSQRTGTTFMTPAGGSGSRTFSPQAEYNVDLPANQPIRPNTALAPGITLAKFLGTRSPADISNVSGPERIQLARNYWLHAHMLRSVMTRPGPHPSRFANHRLEVSEGFYEREIHGIAGVGGLQEETLTENSIRWKRHKGLVVVYDLIGPDGKIDNDATFDLVTDWNERWRGVFKTLTLDYDTLDPSGLINAQIIVDLGSDVPSSYTVNQTSNVQTMFNNRVYSSSSIVEMKDEVEPDQDPITPQRGPR